ncbi:uncharacterized protein C2845_PM05G14590 [Panicum miliaceum]|uniref:Uncharacterized protein n=1 Tax=Panicum miliaceum TaxID=4540 RepID=A0A3L6SWB1_PANMI|nr:uncharacterized protein C2845_PM05G14590 [Panicum miliaceum]
MAPPEAKLAAAAGDVEEAAAPLVPGSGARRASASAASPRDVHLLSSAFLFVFLAYHAAQNLQSTVNTVRAPAPAARAQPTASLRGRCSTGVATAQQASSPSHPCRRSQDENLGSISLGVLYTSFTAFSAVGSAVVRWMGSRRALVVGTSGYLLFIAANLAPSCYTVVDYSKNMGEKRRLKLLMKEWKRSNVKRSLCLASWDNAFNRSQSLDLPRRTSNDVP